MSDNKRKDPRRGLKWIGLIVNTDGTIFGECMTVDISATGAKITAAELKDVPDEFVLILSKKNRVKRNCKVAWRSEKQIGVRFLTAKEQESVRNIDASS